MTLLLSAIFYLCLGVGISKLHAAAGGPIAYALCITACEAACGASCLITGPVCTACMGLCWQACVPACFSNSTLVHTLNSMNKTVIAPIESLLPGDKVLTLSNDDNNNNAIMEYTNVEACVVHSNPIGFDFVQIDTSGGHSVKVTVNHVMAVYVDGVIVSKRADKLVIGDLLSTTSGVERIVAVIPSLQLQKVQLVTASGTVLVASPQQTKRSSLLTTTLCNDAEDFNDPLLPLVEQLQIWRAYHKRDKL